MKKKLFIGFVLVIVGILIWYFFIKIDKKKAAKIIQSANVTRNLSAILELDEDYLISWATAIKAPSIEFTHNGKTYITTTGKEKI